jgi:hypothetical protein
LHEKFCKVCGKPIDLRAMFCPKHKYTFFTPNMKGEHHTVKSKKIIGQKSAAKFTKEFIKRVYHDRHIGNRKVTQNGYILIKSYDHPNRNKADDMMEHRLVMEKYLKRYLKRSEIVHHIDFNRKNNDIKNLYLYKNHSDHHKSHSSVYKLMPPLLKMGIVVFKNGEYIIKGAIKNE